MTAAMAYLALMCGATDGGIIDVQCAPTGVFDVKVDGRTVMRGELSCHGPQWQGVDQTEARDLTGPEAGRVSGAMAMPPGNKGLWRFDETVRQVEGGNQIDYAVTFEQDNEIKLQALTLRLPEEVFAGRSVTFFPAESRIELPRAKSGLRSEHFGWAAAVELDSHRVLLIRTDQATLLSLMDYRQWNGKGFGLNIRMVGEGKVPAGASTRRRITLSVVSPSEAKRVSARWWPDFDRTQPSLLLDANGRVWMRDRQRDYVTGVIEPQGIHWAYSSQDEMVGWSDDWEGGQTITGTIPVRGPGGTSLWFRQTARAREDGVDLAYAFRFPRDCRLNTYQVTWALRTEAFLGRQIILTEPLPVTTSASRPTSSPRVATSQRALVIGLDPPEKPDVGTFTVSRVTVAPGHPLGFVLELDRPTKLFVEDRRAEDGQEYMLKIHSVRDKEGTEVRAGASWEVGVRVRPNRRHQIVLDDAAFAHRTDTSDWIPFTLPWDTTAVDLSFLNAGPAGRHGFLQVRDDRFVFADGTPGRFWGTCFTAEQNLPPHRDAEVTARRLARYGANMVRIHQADAGYAGDNLFRKGRKHNRTRSLDPKMMDRLDYLIAQLEANGIYVYFDLLSTRTFDASDGVASAEKLDLGGKPYTNFDEHLIALQEEFARQFLTHVNPYTKLAYKDDPGVAMVALVNENDVFSREIKIEPYRTAFEDRYRAWAGLREVDLPDGTVDLRHMTPRLMEYLIEVQRSYNERMMRFLRSLGVRVPITGSNWTANAGLVRALGPVDFTDSHAYWDHCWDNYTRIRNRVMVLSRRTIFGQLAFQRVCDKPFFCSEWGQPWPNEFRSEMPLSVASVTGLQGWDGALIYTYAHYSDPNVDCLSGPFDTLNDPTLFGLFYHAALIVRRADVSVAKGRLAVRIPEKEIFAEKPAWPGKCPAYDVAAERSVVATAADGEVPSGWRTIPCRKSLLGPTEHVIVSDTGEYRRDWETGVARLDTPRTQAAWGFLGRVKGPIVLGDVELRVTSPFAAVAVSSLADSPIATSDRLLVTAVARAENTGMVYDLFHTRRIAAGHGPILIEPVRGRVSIRTSRNDLRVRGLDPRGRETIELPVRREGDRVSFEIGPGARTMYYEIRAGGLR
ncbi:MAG: hypothetical protein JXQ73_30530 [Phycisphaerae bacterium]|nr:hypothetical protein [Phycisphaerae bacterium]